MQKLVSYFTDGIASQTLETVGMEIETQFVDKSGTAIQTQTSQQILDRLAQDGWKIDCRKGNLITTLADQDGNKIFYELGRHNMEVSTVASTSARGSLNSKWDIWDTFRHVSDRVVFGGITKNM